MAETGKIKTAFDRPQSYLDDYERKILSNIDEYGWHGTYVMSDENQPGFTYSVGFWLNATAPEVLICGLPQENGHNLLWSLFDSWRGGQLPPVGQPVTDILKGFDCYFFPVSKRAYSTYPRSAQWFYGGDDFPCFQLVWPDFAGIFPWQDGFDEKFSRDQPDVSEGGWSAQIGQ